TAGTPHISLGPARRIVSEASVSASAGATPVLEAAEIDGYLGQTQRSRFQQFRSAARVGQVEGDGVAPGELRPGFPCRRCGPQLVCYVRADFFREQGSFHRKAVAAGDDEDGYEAGRKRHMGTNLFFHQCQRVSWVSA